MKKIPIMIIKAKRNLEHSLYILDMAQSNKKLKKTMKNLIIANIHLEKVEIPNLNIIMLMMPLLLKMK